MRTIELQGADNVRDLGGIPVEGDRVVAPGLFFRGSAIHSITAADRALLFGKLGISCVIDLRCGWEREAKPDVQVASVENLHIPFYDIDKVGVEYTEPAAGTKVVGRDVACEPTRFYRSLSNALTANQMRDALECVFGHAVQGRPVYIHCSGGKDRAGILALLILTILGASDEEILKDYLLTNVSRDKNYDHNFQRFLRLADGNEERARELTESHRARPENLAAFYASVEERYGGMDPFLTEKLGFGRKRRARLREACTVPAGAPSE